jgi:hypothetical protein
METFLREKCTNTSFLDKYQLSVIYGETYNQNLTKICEKVYLYPGLTETKKNPVPYQKDTFLKVELLQLFNLEDKKK